MIRNVSETSCQDYLHLHRTFCSYDMQNPTTFLLAHLFSIIVVSHSLWIRVDSVARHSGPDPPMRGATLQNQVIGQAVSEAVLNAKGKSGSNRQSLSPSRMLAPMLRLSAPLHHEAYFLHLSNSQWASASTQLQAGIPNAPKLAYRINHDVYHLTSAIRDRQVAILMSRRLPANLLLPSEV